LSAFDKSTPQIGNEYSLGVTTGIIAASLGASSELFQFRNASSTTLARINRITISAAVTTTMFAAGVPVELALFKATGWSAAGTGGTAVSPAALLKRRTRFGSSAMASGDIRIATTGALGAGTKTLETLALSTVLAGGPITGALDGTFIQPGTVLWECSPGDDEHPLILGNNEGLSLVSVAVPGTGTWRLGVNVYWGEVGAY
jgi:hypothetical protein